MTRGVRPLLEEEEGKVEGKEEGKEEEEEEEEGHGYNPY
jgi:hypothetical protein